MGRSCLNVESPARGALLGRPGRLAHPPKRADLRAYVPQHKRLAESLGADFAECKAPTGRTQHRSAGCRRERSKAQMTVFSESTTRSRASFEGLAMMDNFEACAPQAPNTCGPCKRRADKAERHPPSCEERPRGKHHVLVLLSAPSRPAPLTRAATQLHFAHWSVPDPFTKALAKADAPSIIRFSPVWPACAASESARLDANRCLHGWNRFVVSAVRRR